MTQSRTKFEVRRTSRFKKDVKAAERRGLDMRELDSVIAALSMGVTLPARFRDHALAGQWSGFRECHIRPDWLLVYAVNGTTLILVLQRTGTHAELFGE